MRLIMTVQVLGLKRKGFSCYRHLTDLCNQADNSLLLRIVFQTEMRFILTCAIRVNDVAAAHSHYGPLSHQSSLCKTHRTQGFVRCMLSAVGCPLASFSTLAQD